MPYAKAKSQIRQPGESLKPSVPKLSVFPPALALDLFLKILPMALLDKYIAFVLPVLASCKVMIRICVQRGQKQAFLCSLLLYRGVLGRRSYGKGELIRNESESSRKRSWSVGREQELKLFGIVETDWFCWFACVCYLRASVSQPLREVVSCC